MKIALILSVFLVWAIYHMNASIIPTNHYADLDQDNISIIDTSVELQFLDVPASDEDDDSKPSAVMPSSIIEYDQNQEQVELEGMSENVGSSSDLIAMSGEKVDVIIVVPAPAPQVLEGDVDTDIYPFSPAASALSMEENELIQPTTTSAPVDTTYIPIAENIIEEHEIAEASERPAISSVDMDTTPVVSCCGLDTFTSNLDLDVDAPAHPGPNNPTVVQADDDDQDPYEPYNDYDDYNPEDYRNEATGIIDVSYTGIMEASYLSIAAGDVINSTNNGSYEDQPVFVLFQRRSLNLKGQLQDEQSTLVYTKLSPTALQLLQSFQAYLPKSFVLPNATQDIQPQPPPNTPVPVHILENKQTYKPTEHKE